MINDKCNRYEQDYRGDNPPKVLFNCIFHSIVFFETDVCATLETSASARLQAKDFIKLRFCVILDNDSVASITEFQADAGGRLDWSD